MDVVDIGHISVQGVIYLMYVPIETPFATDSSTEEVRVGTGGDSVHLVVRAHDARDLAFHDAHPERHVERVHDVLLAHLLTAYHRGIVFTKISIVLFFNYKTAYRYNQM